MRKKIFLLAGGPGNSPKIAGQLQTALRSSGREHPSVAYIGTASGDSRSFLRWFEPLFRKAGAASLTMVPLAGKKADSAAAEKILRGSEVIFLSGGEVEDGIRGLCPATKQLLRELLAEGKPFVGLSAGSIMMMSSRMAEMSGCCFSWAKASLPFSASKTSYSEESNLRRIWRLIF